jgi:hypothetical protein
MFLSLRSKPLERSFQELLHRALLHAARRSQASRLYFFCRFAPNRWSLLSMNYFIVRLLVAARHIRASPLSFLVAALQTAGALLP